MPDVLGRVTNLCASLLAKIEASDPRTTLPYGKQVTAYRTVLRQSIAVEQRLYDNTINELRALPIADTMWYHAFDFSW